MKISACIITFNEERNLGDCLASIAFCDQIVILDSGSTDKTVEVARKFAARHKKIQVTIRNHPFRDFVAQKNHAMKQARHEWVLNIDADERVSDELRDSILAIKNDENRDQSITGYSMNRRNFYLDRWIRHSGWYPDTKVRLVNKNHSSWQGRELHELLAVQSGQVARLEGDLLHYTFRTLSEHLRKIDKYTSIAASEYFRRGKKSNLFWAIMRMAVTFKRSYFFKLGFLDGTSGFVLAMMSAYHTFLKYAKLRYLNQSEKKS